jgi:N,N'-diacetylchitobiose transport system permease protein
VPALAASSIFKWLFDDRYGFVNYYVVITSLKPRSEIYTRTPDLWPNHPQWHQYSHVFGEGHVGRALLNSLVIAGATTLICVVVAGMAAYALARLDVPFRRTLLMLILTTQMFPLVVLIIPLFVLMRNADLIGTYQGLVVTYLAFTVPLAIWIMRGFIVTMTFMNTEERKTLPLVLQSFVGRGDTDWGAVMATSVIYTLPVVIFFLLLRKRLMLGMTAGAVKG